MGCPAVQPFLGFSACRLMEAAVDVAASTPMRLKGDFHENKSHILRSSGVVIALLLADVALEARGAQPLAEVIASVPNRINPWPAEANPLPPLERLLGVDQQFWVKVGPPEASLSVSVVEPRGKSPSPRGTILMLHGVLDRSAVMLPAARAWPMRATARSWSISAGGAVRPASS